MKKGNVITCKSALYEVVDIDLSKNLSYESFTVVPIWREVKCLASYQLFVLLNY
jgi:hypothetical protein